MILAGRESLVLEVMDQAHDASRRRVPGLSRMPARTRDIGGAAAMPRSVGTVTSRGLSFGLRATANGCGDGALSYTAFPCTESQ